MLSKRAMMVRAQCSPSDKTPRDAMNAHNAAVGDLVKKLQKSKEDYENKRKHHIRHIMSSVHSLVLDDIEFVKTVTQMKRDEMEEESEVVIDPEVVEDDQETVNRQAP